MSFHVPAHRLRRISYTMIPRQRGVTLIELMVGITIGLLTIAVAVGALMVSRGVSGTISDASQLQQQASYAFRIIGQQVRQAGSMRLNLAANKPPTDPIMVDDVVAFSPNTEIFSSIPGVPPNVPPVTGKDAPASGEYKLSVAYQNYEEPSFISTPTPGSNVSFFRDCLASQPSATIIQNQFILENGELRCAGSDNSRQSIIRNVSEFQVRYLLQNRAAALTGLPTIQYLDATGVGTNWGSVFGVEVCLVLYGDERIDVPAGSTYTGCNGAVDMTNSGPLTASEKNRLHMTFRSVYQLRSQGLAG